MKKYRNYLIFLAICMILPMKTKALVCENDTRVKWINLAQNITYTYDAVETNGKVSFNITFSNIAKGLQIKDFKNDKVYNYKGNELVLKNYENKKSYRFDIYTTEDYCYLEVLYTINIIIPAYNSFYKDDMCKGIENYYLCQKWQNVDMEYNVWKQSVASYLESLNIKKEEPKKKEETLAEKVLEVYSKVYYIVLPVLIIGGGVGIYLYNKKHDLF